MHSSVAFGDKSTTATQLQAPTIANPERATQLFKVLADPTRLQILYIIAQNRGKEICAVDLSEALNVSAPTVTHHMKKLTEARLVVRRKQGKWAYYEIIASEFDRISALISSL